MQVQGEEKEQRQRHVLKAGEGGKRQSCLRHGHPAAKAWGPEAEAAQGPMEGQLGNLLPQGPIFSSQNITAQCAHSIQKLVVGVLKKNSISERQERFRYGPNVNSEAKPPR